MRRIKFTRGMLLCAAGMFLAIVAVGVYLQPGYRTPSDDTQGDADLVVFMTPLLRGARHHVAVALVTPDGVKYGLWGSTFDQSFEIGSLTKTLTAALFYDAIQRGEISADTRVGTVIPELTGPIRESTLAELASHRSGLPMLAAPWRDKVAILSAILHHRNPWVYGSTAVIRMVNSAQLENHGAFLYSNTGYALLGIALERVTQRPYATLLRERVLAPVKMDNTAVATGTGIYSSGQSASGFREAPWVLSAMAPASGVRSTIVDMARYAQGLLDGTLPGSGTMMPHFATDEEGTDIGYAWFISRHRGYELTWHEGSTAGFASIIALDRKQRRAVVVLSDTAWPMVNPAIKLLVSQVGKKDN